MSERADGKTLDPGGTPNTMRNRARESVARGGQARTLVYDLRASGIDLEGAHHGIAKIRGTYGSRGVHGHRLDMIVVIGDGFYLEEAL